METGGNGTERRRTGRPASPARPKAVGHGRGGPGKAGVVKPPLSAARLGRRGPTRDKMLKAVEGIPRGAQGASRGARTVAVSRPPGPTEQRSRKLDGKGPPKRGRSGPSPTPDAGTLRILHTDSSSDISDCVSEPLSISDESKCALGVSTDKPEWGSDRERSDCPCEPDGDVPTKPDIDCDSGMEAESVDSRTELRPSRDGEQAVIDEDRLSAQAGSDGLGDQRALEEELDLLGQDLLREVDELRSENTYLKDEVEELRAEMEEMRDGWLEDDVQQLQELRRELDRANKTCRILQYRLRKAERRGLRTSHTGQVDGELIRGLEQDLKVAKDVSVRLHQELESLEDKRARVEEENDELRQKQVELEIGKQAMRNEMEKMKESSLRRRNSREYHRPDRKSLAQEDNADLKCQLQFLKEEATLMRRKTVRLSKDHDHIEQELQRYKVAYGELEEAPLTAERGVAQEAELRLRLRLVEEEASILSRKIVELEVENRGLRAEMEDSRCRCGKSGGIEHESCEVLGGEQSESACELRRHLQFVEEEAEVLRRSVLELEEQNRLMSEDLNRFQGRSSVISWDEDSSETHSELALSQEKVVELGKTVAKLQYEKRLLLSSIQRLTLSHAMVPADMEEIISCNVQELSQNMQDGETGGDSDAEVPSNKANFDMTSIDNPELPEDRKTNFVTSCKPQILERVKRQAAAFQKAMDDLISKVNSSCGHVQLAVACQELDAEESKADDCTEEFQNVSARISQFSQEIQSFIDKVNVPEDISDGGLSQYSMTRDYSLDFQLKESQQVLSEANSTIIQLQSQLNQEHEQRAEDAQRYEKHIAQLRMEQRKLALRRDFELQSLGLQQKLERREHAQERRGLARDLRQLRHSLALVYARLRGALANWRLSRRKGSSDTNGFMELDESSDLMEDISVASTQSESTEDSGIQSLFESFGDKKEEMSVMETLTKWDQAGDGRRLLLDLRAVVEELEVELAEERKGCREVQQQYATEKAAWQVERAELKFLMAQLEDASGQGPLQAELMSALRAEREEQQGLLAELQARCVELWRRLDAGERSWARERAELLERFEHERRDWEQQLRLMRHKVQQLQKERMTPSAMFQGGPNVDQPKDRERFGAGTQSTFESILQKSSHPPAFHSLVLDALILDSGPTREKLQRVKHLQEYHNQAQQEECNRQGVDDSEDRNSLRRSKSISSISEFDALMESSPDSSNKTSPVESESPINRRDSFSLPFLPCLPYSDSCTAINSRGSSRVRCSGHSSSEESLLGSEAGSSSWYLASHAELGMDVTSNPTQHMDAMRSLADEGITDHRYIINLDNETNSGFSFETANGSETGWPPGLSGHRCESSESGIIPDAQSPSSTEPELSGNLSDDMKEAANSLHTNPVERVSRDIGCQTHLTTSTGTQTVRRMVHIGLQTDCMRCPSNKTFFQQHISPEIGSSSTRSVARCRNVALEKMQSRFDRNCSSRLGSPRFQRNISGRNDMTRPGKDLPCMRTESWKGLSESAWARSTTTRDSPVHTTSNSGLSSLFTFVDHSTEAQAESRRTAKSMTSRPRSTEPARSNDGVIQEILKNVQERSASSGNSQGNNLGLPVAKPIGTASLGSKGQEPYQASNPAEKNNASSSSPCEIGKAMKSSIASSESQLVSARELTASARESSSLPRGPPKPGFRRSLPRNPRRASPLAQKSSLTNKPSKTKVTSDNPDVKGTEDCVDGDQHKDETSQDQIEHASQKIMEQDEKHLADGDTPDIEEESAVIDTIKDAGSDEIPTENSELDYDNDDMEKEMLVEEEPDQKDEFVELDADNVTLEENTLENLNDPDTLQNDTENVDISKQEEELQCSPTLDDEENFELSNDNEQQNNNDGSNGACSDSELDEDETVEAKCDVESAENELNDNSAQDDEDSERDVAEEGNEELYSQNEDTSLVTETEPCSTESKDESSGSDTDSQENIPDEEEV
uniref:microtubule cross-linking factor 2-like isoform X2 n=1 Tax=Myxine glutinosa TaxID=7769 RepID=UPI00358F4841